MAMTAPYPVGEEPTIELDNALAAEIIALSDDADTALLEGRKHMNRLYEFALLAVCCSFTTGVMMAYGYWVIGCFGITGILGALAMAHVCRYKRDTQVGKAWMKTGEMSRVCEGIIKSSEREYRQRMS